MVADKRVLADWVVGYLVDGIARGDFSPGAMLPSETDLAKSIGVSRLTIREAITILKTKRVIEVQHGRGTFVNPLSLWTPFDPMLLEIKFEGETGAGALPRKLVEARRLVEVGVAELAACRRSESDLETLARTIAIMESSSDIDTIADADLAFHRTVMAAAGNVVVAALFDPIEQLVREARRQTTTYPEMRMLAIGWHKRILKAIRDRDPEAARNAMRDHLAQTEEYLDSYLKEHSTTRATGGSIHPLSASPTKPHEIPGVNTRGSSSSIREDR